MPDRELSDATIDALFKDQQRQIDGIGRLINGLPVRVAELTVQVTQLRSEVKDAHEEIGKLRKDYNSSQRGMSRGEKIAFSSAVAALIVAVVSVIALLGAPA